MLFKKSKNNKGSFITFEGIDGSGKTTALSSLKEKIVGDNIIFTREPGGTSVSQQIRNVIFDNNMNRYTELLLMYAARNELIHDIIDPNLSKNNIIFCDRFVDSTYIYQGKRNNISINEIELLNKLIVKDLKPDLTFLFDLPAHIAYTRKKEQQILTGEWSRFDEESQSKLRDEYLLMAKAHKERFIILDLTKSQEEIIIEILNTLLTLDFIESIK